MDLQNFAEKRICVAISGGVDSVVLLHYLKSQATACGFNLLAAHCEHGIRGENSLADMRFVQDFCEELGVPLVVFRADCPALAKAKKCSLETAAREFRRECFASLITDGKADFVATAHHLLDEAETVLFRLARGCSLTGAKGMGEQDGCIIRPLLGWSKEEILAYAEKNGLAYRVDESNLEREFTRNKLRLEVLPRLNEAVPGASRNLAAFARRAAEDDEVLYDLAKGMLLPLPEIIGEGFLIAFSKKAPLFNRACLLALKELGVEKDYTSAHLNAIFALQNSEKGAKIDLPRGIEAEQGKLGMFIRRKREKISVQKPQPKTFDFLGFDGGRYEVILSNEPMDCPDLWGQVLRADGDKLDGAQFRFRQDGDEIKRFGGGTKSLKKFFNEEKVPVEEREYIPLIAKGNEVLVVCGVEISEKVKVCESTKNTAYIYLKKILSNA
ncbi:MAG: tRNA lysidine(34) synthetase TilS [Clostridia bacterium]|nr:tRNA lysidine(34) synthetase TilS [Clostridia bacterium]MBQ7913734.1 tRNA lysidine(34) synthetase TilS [Clostridia bacterium]